MADILFETREAFRQALARQQGDLEEKLSAFGLSISDIPNRCYAVKSNRYPITTTYFFDGHPIFETKLFIDGYTIRAEVNPL